MNAAIPAIKLSAAPARTSSTPNEASGADSGKAAAGAQDFAGALHAISGKGPRKIAEAANGSGGPTLPQSGSASPPPAAASPPASPLLAAAPSDGPGVGLADPDAATSTASDAALPALGAVPAAAQGPLDAILASESAGPTGAGAQSASLPSEAVAGSAAERTIPAQGAVAVPLPASSNLIGARSSASDPTIDTESSTARAQDAQSSAEGRSGELGAYDTAMVRPAAAGATAGAAELSRAGGADASNAVTASAPSIVAAELNLALAEGSDATGASARAAALEAADSPAAAPLAALQVRVPLSTAVDPAAATAILAVSPVVPEAASLANDSNAHAHGDPGDPGSDTTGADAAAALQQLSAAPSASGETAAAPTLKVHADVGSADFPQALSDRVSFMMSNGWSNAKLSVNPPQLGPIELEIAVQGQRAQVLMSTHSAVAREALESSVPKLKDMLNSQGFAQVSVDISQRSFQDRSARAPLYDWPPPPPDAPAAVCAPGSAQPRVAVGMVDAYA